ncbi:MAG TPA: hypothetical protein VHB20_10245 [Verrucomicrobiae bacterium]|jgi:hypothetical protein|nr:hypothetical protein [Verrucomicrobiae bacterium]
MNPEQENFDALRKLMALKRHETPPPGYFDHLPRRIATRIRDQEGAPNFWESLVARLRLSASTAYAFGLTACGALALTVVYTARTETARADSTPRNWAVSWDARESAALAAQPAAAASQELHTAAWLGDTNPAARAYQLPSLFARPLQPATMPTAYELH